MRKCLSENSPRRVRIAMMLLAAYSEVQHKSKAIRQVRWMV
jgi:hypothetical protein